MSSTSQGANAANPRQAITDLYMQLMDLKKRIREAVREQMGPGVPQDYVFAGEGGPVRLRELFGEHDDLLVIHNMGKSCNYCTLWADGLAGFAPMIEERCALALSSPDAPDVQARVKRERGWPYRMVSVKDNTFAHDMGFVIDEGYMPGVSAFHKDKAGEITRTGAAYFGPGDDFCAIWPLFELLEGGARGWEPAP